MKRIVWVFSLVLCLSALLRAADEAHAMKGWLCDSKCVVQNGDQATCDAACSERSGSAVFIDDQGQTFQVSNSSSWSQFMNKRVKGMGTMDKDNPHMLTWRELLQEEGGIGH